MARKACATFDNDPSDKLSAAQIAALAAIIEASPNVETNGVTR